LAEAASIEGRPAFGVTHSAAGRRWSFCIIAEAAAHGLASAAHISVVLARLLTARGIGEKDVGDYLNPTLRNLLPEPFLLKDMDAAVARTVHAIEAGERIAVFGDYDVDGSTSAALARAFLRKLGIEARIYIPDRMREGYGPSPEAMRTLREEGASLVITVDCGAAALAALTTAREIGLDAIVLDHHRVERAVPAIAHVNPNRAGDESGLGHLCAAGVTFLFVVALNRALRESGWYTRHAVAEPDLRGFLDMVGLATLCDVVPLVGINRAFVRQGLAQMARLERPGLVALAKVAQVVPPFTPYHLGFVFGPRINAGGRVGRSGLGVDLLSADDAACAEEFALQLDSHNRERQAIEKLILEDAIALAALQDNTPFLLVSKEGWHPGVVGIVASRLKERFGKPAFVAGFEGGMGRGSARSIPGIDIGTMVRAAREAGYIESGGGHAMAAGFALEAHQMEGFGAFLAERFTSSGAALAAAGDFYLDASVSPAGATPELVAEIAAAGPFGAGNAEPILGLPDVKVAFADVVGKDHVRLRLEGGDGARLDAIAFRVAQTPLGKGLLAARGRAIHAAGRLKIDEWNGKIRVQLHLEDAAPAQA
jgi:single-stranded-DNA-specific exonuclease